MKKIILILIIGTMMSCKSRENLYVQAMVKTEHGYKRVGSPKPHLVLLGDTINVIYNKKF